MVNVPLTPERRRRLEAEGATVFRDDGDYARTPSLELGASSEGEARIRLRRALETDGAVPDLFLAGPWGYPGARPLS